MHKILGLMFSIALMVLSQSSWAEQHKILFINGSHSNQAKLSLLKDMADKKGIAIERKSQKELGDLEKAAVTFAAYGLVVMEAVSTRESKQIYAQYAPVVSQTKGRTLAINWLEAENLRKGVSEQQAQDLHDYYSNGGTENLSRMLDYLNYKVLSDDARDVAEPIIYPAVGIYHPDYEGLVFDNLDEYLQWHEVESDNTPIVGVLMQRALIESVETQVVDATIKQLESQGVTAVPFFFELSPQTTDYSALIQQDGETVIDLIINFRAIHWASKRKQEFTDFGVPVIQALTYYDGDQKHWENSTQGISPGMTPFILVLPEAAGVVDPMIVAALNEESGKAEVIDYQLEHLINKSLNIIKLKTKANVDKRMSVMVWGSRDVGASFLNVPESLRVMSAKLNEEGYGVNVVDSDYFTDRIDRILSPFYKDYELDKLLEDDLAELMPVSDYVSWFNTLPESVRKPINDYWGEPKNNFMVV